MLLYRVLPYLSSADSGSPGHPLFVPAQGGGRLDNPDVFSVLYLSDSASGAIAEAFGRFPEWNASILLSSPSLPGSRRVLARYRLTASKPICDLDDAKRLLDLALRPSDVVSRDYERTRGWTRRIFLDGAWCGIRWWSYYDPRWASFGLWDWEALVLEDVAPLTLRDSALLDAAHAISRPVIG